MTSNYKKFLLVTFFLAVVFLLGWPKEILAFSVGEQAIFNVDPLYDHASHAKVNAVLNLIGDKGLFYVEEEWWKGLEQPDEAQKYISSLAAEFDKNIYPTLTQFYGQEWSPGIDNEFKITILITKMQGGAGGYFNSIDEYSKNVFSSSNEKEMIYLNAAFFDSPRWKAYLAHEFQHLISFYQKEKLGGSKDDTWLEEGRSEFALTLCGYDANYNDSNLARRVSVFLNNPTDSLTEWQDRVDDYAPVVLFTRYLVSRYGPSILSETIKLETIGIASINQFLAKKGLPEQFVDIFADWTLANFVNDCKLGENKRFCYNDPQLDYSVFHIGPTLIRALSGVDGDRVSFEGLVNDWSPSWYKINSGGGVAALQITINSGPETKQIFSVLMNYKDGSQSLKRLAIEPRESNLLLIDSFGEKISSVVLIPFSYVNSGNFSSYAPVYPLAFSVKIVSGVKIPLDDNISLPVVILPLLPSSSSILPEKPAVKQPSYLNGSLIRAQGDRRVFVVKGDYKRWIQSPDIFAAYPHFSWQSVIEVTPSVRDWYREVWLVRADGDKRVYEINGDGTKHWLNMSAEEFSISGRKWEMVYIVNQRELNLYKSGAEIVK